VQRDSEKSRFGEEIDAVHGAKVAQAGSLRHFR
jgi:hypothetical protein